MDARGGGRIATIAVLGAGAIGGLYGTLLARKHDVYLIMRGETYERAIREGLDVFSVEFGQITPQPNAIPINDISVLDGKIIDLLLITCKSTSIKDAYDDILRLGRQSLAIMPLCNVLGVAEGLAVKLAGTAANRVLVGHTSVEVTQLQPGVVAQLSKRHKIYVGCLTPDHLQLARDTTALFTDAGLTAELARDGVKKLWQRGAVFIPLAALTAYFQTSWGPIMKSKRGRFFMEQLANEYAQLASMYGYATGTTATQALWAMDRLPRSMETSLARDLRDDRPSELRLRVGMVLTLAARIGLLLPTYHAVYTALQERRFETLG